MYVHIFASQGASWVRLLETLKVLASKRMAPSVHCPAYSLLPWRALQLTDGKWEAYGSI